MGIEEKAKAYDEALERARQIKNGENGWGYSDLVEITQALEEVFPQLRESEDERMMRVIGLALMDVPEERFASLGTTLKDCLACLKKQKEQKPAEKKTTLNGFEKALDSFLFDFAHSSIADCEPKEYVKNHSAYLLKAAYKELNAQLKQDLFEAQQEGRREGYEAAKNELKPTEWSEEDEVYLQDALWCVNQAAKIARGENDMGACWSAERWLKSLRPQSHWKPNEYLLSLVKKVASGEMLTHMEQMSVERLYDDLQKL